MGLVREGFGKDLCEGHADVKTSKIYTHVLQQNLDSVQSPLNMWAEE